MLIRQPACHLRVAHRAVRPDTGQGRLRKQWIAAGTSVGDAPAPVCPLTPSPDRGNSQAIDDMLSMPQSGPTIFANASRAKVLASSTTGTGSTFRPANTHSANTSADFSAAPTDPPWHYT